MIPIKLGLQIILGTIVDYAIKTQYLIWEYILKKEYIICKEVKILFLQMFQTEFIFIQLPKLLINKNRYPVLSHIKKNHYHINNYIKK